MRSLCFFLLLSACTDAAEDKDVQGEDSGETGLATGEGEGEGEGEETGLDTWWGEDGTIEAFVLEGVATWALTFDEEGEANGYTDCSYSRSFSGVQALDLDYLCPECEIITRGVSTMTDGLDCYASVFGEEDAGDRVEMWGVDEDGWFYRSGRDQGAMGQLTEIVAAEDADIAIAWESEYTLTAGGAMTLSASGTMRYARDPEILLEDPWAPRTEPYACGWPQNDPGTLTLDYTLTEGGTFPNVRLKDQCGDDLALWDLYGSYLIIDSSQPDCGPCRSMASEAEAFKAQMEEEGISVFVVSLLGNGLADPMSTPDEDTLNAWVSDYGLLDPVLYDRGFAYALFPEFSETFTGEDFGYPVWLVVDPEMNLIYANIGFSSWDPVAELLREDWESR